MSFHYFCFFSSGLMAKKTFYDVLFIICNVDHNNTFALTNKKPYSSIKYKM